ncbi:MAG: hypothetical protein EAX81_07580 [Candidatus Thorarchaeota archaeon]|nr:hypothetical protein [Candidatus Thorarchaeota archaeon]
MNRDEGIGVSCTQLSKLDIRVSLGISVERFRMKEVACPRCGYKETAMVKKEMLGNGGYRRHFRCPRCSNTWETKD